MIAIAACAALLAACAPDYVEDTYTRHSARASAAKKTASKARIPLPDRVLLIAQRVPNCEGVADTNAPRPSEGLAGRTATDAAEQSPAPAKHDGLTPASVPQASSEAEPKDANADLVVRVKLEYEKECYRRAEERVRDRLHRLQGWATWAVKAGDSTEQSVR